MQIADTHESLPDTRPALSVWQQAALSLYWFAAQAHWTAILLLLLPAQSASIGGPAAKGSTLGLILLFGALASMVVAPFFGAWSDRVRTRWGRRKPFLVAGTLCNVAGLVAIAFVPATRAALPAYILLFVWLQVANNLSTAPYSALIPDVVPAAQRGAASGWMGLMMMLGNLVGAAMGLGLAHIGGISGAYLLLAGLMLLGMLGTVLTVREPAVTAPPPPFALRGFLRGLLEPFRAADFRWVFLTRFLVMLGIFTVQENLLFYMQDMVGGGQQGFVFRFFTLVTLTDAGAAASCFLFTLLIGAVLSSLFAGGLSDRYGRKVMVYISGALQGIAALALLATGQFAAVVLLGIFFGLGYGAYQAVDWALVTDVLPSAGDHAKDMGLWHIAVTLPQVTAAPIAGLLLDHFNALGTAHAFPTLGYFVIFPLAFVYFVLGTVLVTKINGAR